jgi:hypothetical protein
MPNASLLSLTDTHAFIRYYGLITYMLIYKQWQSTSPSNNPFEIIRTKMVIALILILNSDYFVTVPIIHCLFVIATAIYSFAAHSLQFAQQ